MLEIYVRAVHLANEKKRRKKKPKNKHDFVTRETKWKKKYTQKQIIYLKIQKNQTHKKGECMCAIQTNRKRKILFHNRRWLWNFRWNIVRAIECRVKKGFPYQQRNWTKLVSWKGMMYSAAMYKWHNRNQSQSYMRMYMCNQ